MSLWTSSRDRGRCGWLPALLYLWHVPFKNSGREIAHNECGRARWYNILDDFNHTLLMLQSMFRTCIHLHIGTGSSAVLTIDALATGYNHRYAATIITSSCRRIGKRKSCCQIHSRRTRIYRTCCIQKVNMTTSAVSHTLNEIRLSYVSLTGLAVSLVCRWYRPVWQL